MRSTKSEITPYAAAGAGIILAGAAFFELSRLKELTDFLSSYGSSAVFTPIMKALLVSMLCQFTAEICRDFGENSVASKVELGGKAVIIYLSIPLIKEVLKNAGQML